MSERDQSIYPTTSPAGLGSPTFPHLDSLLLQCRKHQRMSPPEPPGHGGVKRRRRPSISSEASPGYEPDAHEYSDSAASGSTPRVSPGGLSADALKVGVRGQSSASKVGVPEATGRHVKRLIKHKRTRTGCLTCRT